MCESHPARSGAVCHRGMKQDLMASPRTGSLRIAILVMAFNAASTLAQVLDRTAPDFGGR
jgi:hypothetical protein